MWSYVGTQLCLTLILYTLLSAIPRKSKSLLVNLCSAFFSFLASLLILKASSYLLSHGKDNILGQSQGDTESLTFPTF